MIWYLLSPLRGTSKPPRLSQEHIIRRLFYRHGILTAQHWLPAMLVSCAIAAALAYPTVFLSGNPTAGFTSKPHQIWAAARAVDDVPGTAVDIEMRQIWVHGSYMKALDKNVLQSALRIQQSIFGIENLTSKLAEAGQASDSEPMSWAFHSPLMYWNNSANAIESDLDVAKTINDQAQSSSSLKVSLRPASVFAGKTFTRSKLMAADALVMTLMNRVEDAAGLRWQQKMHSLEDGACPQCKLYPPQGEISRSWLYEFTFTPVTFQENVTLAILYGCLAIYVLLSLQRLKAFHSRFGLVVTAITQMVMSILASFTICGLMKVNLVAVPQNAYPFVLLVIGVENMFRLINAILAYPPTMATDLRIANALGDVGPLSIATLAQNLLTLWLLSLVVSPAIVAFCTFAAIATLVDTFFLLTFFVAVLNVDIRRLELQDTLSRSKEAAQKQSSPTPKRSWFDALLQGRLPLSTRMAGSVVTTTFILTLNFYFFERTERKMSLRRLLGLRERSTAGPIDFDTFAPPPMNATLTPGEWVRMQDFDTAREVMRLVNAGAQSFVIRVFTPLVIVLSGADRTGTQREVAQWNEDLREFTLHHIYPFAVVVIFIVTFVAVLMNFLLWNDAPEKSEVILPSSHDDDISVQHVRTCHKLDIVKIYGSGNGYLVTVGMDRSVNIVDKDRTTGAFISVPLSSELSSVLRFRPILRVVIDDTGRYLAFHTTEDTFVICDRSTNDVVVHTRYDNLNTDLLFQFVYLGGKQDGLLAFAFMSSPRQFHLIVMTAEAVMRDFAIHGPSFVSAKIMNTGGSQRILFVAAGAAHVGTAELRSFKLTVNGLEFERSVELGMSAKTLKADSQTIEISQYDHGPEQRIIVRSGSTLHVIHAQTLEMLKQWHIAEPGAQLRGWLCRADDSNGSGLVALLERRLGENLIAQQLNDLDHNVAGHSVSIPIITENNSHEFTTSIKTPAFWLIMPTSRFITGVRRKLPLKQPLQASVIRSRSHKQSTKAIAADDEVEWEAYVATMDGEIAAVQFASTDNVLMDGDDQPLFVTKAGPGAAFDDYSMAVAIGNMLKIISISRSSLQLPGSGVPDIERHGSTSRRRGGLRKTQ